MYSQKSYFLSFYFQVVQEVSVIESEVRFISIAITQIFVIIMINAIMTKTRHYVSLCSLTLLSCFSNYHSDFIHDS